jgi:hypothetical protein
MIIVAEKSGQVDSAYHSLVKHIPTNKTIVMVSWAENFVFNDALLDVKDYVLICFCEYGWDKDLRETGSHIWGANSDKFPRYYTGDWVRFDNWVKENSPSIMLKRELLKQDVSDAVRPIEYPCTVNHWEVDTEEFFNNRPINCFQYWGRSSEHRLRIHGDIWHHASKKGFSVCDNIYYIASFLEHEQGEKWVSLNIPHWARTDINQLMPINALSKLSLSWGGAGFKCFRTAEAPVNSVMVMWKNDYAWSYQWDESNCILVEHGKELDGIDAALNRIDLFQVYKKGVETANKYRTEPYINNYILPIINNA